VVWDQLSRNVAVAGAGWVCGVRGQDRPGRQRQAGQGQLAGDCRCADVARGASDPQRSGAQDDARHDSKAFVFGDHSLRQVWCEDAVGAGWATRGRKVQTYRCTRDECGVTVQRDLVDGQVKKAVVEAFESGEPLGADDGDDAARRAIEIELEEARAAETRLADAIADNVISADAARARSALIKADIERLAGELQAIQQRSAKAGMLTAGYAEMLQALPSDRPEYWGDPAHAEELVGWLHLRTYECHEGLSRVQAMEKVVAAVHTGELQRRFDALPWSNGATSCGRYCG
jgi:hypothetical protein